MTEAQRAQLERLARRYGMTLTRVMEIALDGLHRSTKKGGQPETAVALMLAALRGPQQ